MFVTLPITHWIGTRPAPSCPECGSTPMGTGCYHICSHSVHYYTAEQERYDDANYDLSDYYREAGYDDPDYADRYEDEPAPMFEAVGLIVVDTSDDLPF